MSEDYKVMIVHNRKNRSEKAQLRDQIEAMRCEIENLEREREALIAALSEAGVEWKGLPELNE